MGRAGPPHGHGEPGGLEHRGHGPPRPLRQHTLDVGRPQLLEDLLLALAEELGQDTVDHDGRQPTVVSSLTLVTSSSVSFTGISSGVHTATSPVFWRVGEDVEHPVGLAADQPHLDEVVDGLGRGQLADDVATGRGVDHHEVVVRLAHLLAELAHGEDLTDPRRRGRHEVERLGQRADAAHHRDAQVQRRDSRSDASVSIDIDQSPGAISRGEKSVGPASNSERTSPLASTSQTRTRLPCSAASCARGPRRPSSCQRRPCR